MSFLDLCDELNEFIFSDFLKMFPSRYLDETLTLITLCLKTENDMSIWSEESEEEREKLSQYVNINIVLFFI